MAKPRILVVGSINMDIVARVAHIPAPGENVRGWQLKTIPGGEGVLFQPRELLGEPVEGAA